MSDSRFRAQAILPEEQLQSETTGLVHLDQLRKRRADALEQVDSNSRDASRDGSRVPTPEAQISTSRTGSRVTKKRKPVKGKLSFALDDEADEATDARIKVKQSSSNFKQDSTLSQELSPKISALDEAHSPLNRRLGPNASIGSAPRILTKSAIRKEMQTREELRQEFLSIQEMVKSNEIAIPFVFHDGTNIPGGSCCIKKGDPIWVFLDKCRKVGAELGVGGSGEAKNRREWARVGVDDLMLVRGDIIIPHHYDFYYFIVNKSRGYDGQPIFDYSAQPAKFEAEEAIGKDQGETTGKATSSLPDYSDQHGSGASVKLLEGANDDPSHTKVVNRQWYARNKHIFPASTWEEFDGNKDYAKSSRRDAQGNAFFFSK